MKYIFSFTFIIALCLSVDGDAQAPLSKLTEGEWVDSCYASMSLDERVGQLVMIRAHSDKGPEHIKEVERLIKEYNVGGACFFQGKLDDQKKMIDQCQKRSKFPLLVAQDAEWGMGMRLSDAIDFPRHMTLGALRDNSLVYKTSAAMARQMREMGVHINFAPVSDVNNNADNPVIHNRSFGESREKVAIKSYMFMLGHQDEGVLSCAKHFPGHGDTDLDSHYDLPVLPYDRSRLDSLELYPFRLLADQQVPSMMIAHLQMPFFEPDGITPTSLSKKVVTGILREQYNYDGLIFTDGLEMAGVRKHFSDAQIAVKSILAGNDILLLPQIPEVAINALKTAFHKGELTEQRLALSVKRILRAKFQAGINNKSLHVQPPSIYPSHHSADYYSTISEVAENSITVLDNEYTQLPIRDIANKKIALISACKTSASRTAFLPALKEYADTDLFRVHLSSNESTIASIIKELDKYDHVIVSFDDMSRSPKKEFGISKMAQKFMKNLEAKQINHTAVLFGSPYGLRYLPRYGTKIIGYENGDIFKQKAAQAIFGAFITKGILPVSVAHHTVGDGEEINTLKRLRYDLPERSYMYSDSLDELNLLVDTLIRDHATPGCQILVARDNRIVYHRSFGYHTTSRQRPVSNSDIYDLASITKVASTTLSVMKLYDEGLIDIYVPIKKYLPETDTTDLADLTLYDILAHHAGLKSWIPFYSETLTEGKTKKPLKDYYRRTKADSFSIKITDKLYLMDSYPDSIFYKIINSEVNPVKKYRYSDLGMYLIAEIIKRITGKRIDAYVEDTFYKPLGCTRTGYNPLNKFNKSEIVPSEKDNYWRHRIVQGTVHDMGAAMQDGVSGHAGLFSTSRDLAIIFQMILNGGYYGGKQYIKPETIDLFTTRHIKSQRRGIGWDMKQLDTTRTLNVAPEASEYLFGHLGFTGTAAWADPEHDLIFIFLSNRTYPTMRNNTLNRKDYRPRLQSLVYKSLKN